MSDWSALARASTLRSVFQLPEWVLPWWDFFGNDGSLWTLAIFDDGDLGAVLPLQVTANDAVLRFIGVPLNDRNSIVARDENRLGAWGCALRTMSAERTWARAVLTDLDDVDLACVRASGAVDPLPPEPSPVIHLPNTWDEYRARLLARHGGRVGRRQRRLEQDHDVVFQVLTGTDVTARALVSFYSRRLEQWRLQARLHLLSDLERHPAFPNFLATTGTALAELGQLVLAVLNVDGRPAASCLHFLWSSTALDYMGTYDLSLAQYAPGIVLTMRTIEWMIDQGVSDFDFGRGDEPYKLRLLATPRLLGGIEIC